MPNNNKLYLVALALGPVQDFIAAARRTRDLWFGSFLLSEISKAAAYSLYKDGGSDEHTGLIFPATENPEEDLKPCDANLDKNGYPPFNVPNKIMAVVETDNPTKVLDEAQKAAQERWEVLANDIFNKKLYLTENQIDKAIWDAQLKDLLELFAAWVEYEPGKNDYAEKRKRLECLLAARKNTRNFKPSTVEGSGIPKSSLDGLRESVIADDKKLKDQKKLSLGMSVGEQLDCPGLVKRLGGEPEQFTPLSRIAVDPWLRSLNENKKELLDNVAPVLDEIKALDLGLVSKVRGLGEGEFSYDGQLLYPFRIDAEIVQFKKLSAEEQKGAPELLEKLKDMVEKFTKNYGEPSPYVAILAADGDRMGELIYAAKSKEQHREISTILSGFAKGTAETINKHNGQLIYAGGDDVLAIVPLDTVLDCAEKLATDFTGLWKGINLEKKPTLSVGIGISHMLTPMGKQLELAREAEQIAKNNQDANEEKRKNGLAIIYQPRSGDSIPFCEQWTEEPRDILDKWQTLHEDRDLSYQAAFQLRELDRAIGEWCEPGHALLVKEIKRVLKRKRNDDGNEVDLKIIQAVSDRGKDIGLKKLADELILTQKLATHTKFKNSKEEKETGHV